MKVATQLTLGFSVLIALMAALGGISVYKISSVNDRLIEIRSNWMPSVENSLTMLIDLRGLGLSEYRAATSTDRAQLALAEKRIDAALDSYRKSSEQYRVLIDTAEEKNNFAALQSLFPQYLALDRQVVSLADQDKNQEAQQIVKDQLLPIRTRMEEHLQNIVDANRKGAEREAASAQQAYLDSRWLVLSVTLLSAAVSLLIAVFISRRIARQLGGEPVDAMRLSSEIAAGNLRARLDLKKNDNSSLMYSLAGMRDQLARLVSQIQAFSVSIQTAASEIAQGNTDLSQRTEEQAASLEETASSMEQLTSTVQQNSGNARQASSLASGGAEIARRGEAEISQVIATMGEIAESSNQVSDIISVIEGISFQTNILALNAAVEAARAGENGRGFAVVATEVRALAQRSSTAAKEIKVLIENSVNRIHVGTQLVKGAGGTITEIMHSANRTTEIMKDIADASEEQSAGIGQINTAIVQMDQVTQQNAALVEQAAAAAHALMQQAQELMAAVSVFKLDEYDGISMKTLPQSVPGQQRLADQRAMSKAGPAYAITYDNR